MAIIMTMMANSGLDDENDIDDDDNYNDAWSSIEMMAMAFTVIPMVVMMPKVSLMLMLMKRITTTMRGIARLMVVIWIMMETTPMMRMTMTKMKLILVMMKMIVE